MFGKVAEIRRLCRIADRASQRNASVQFLLATVLPRVQKHWKLWVGRPEAGNIRFQDRMRQLERWVRRWMDTVDWRCVSLMEVSTIWCVLVVSVEYILPDTSLCRPVHVAHRYFRQLGWNLLANFGTQNHEKMKAVYRVPWKYRL